MINSGKENKASLINYIYIKYEIFDHLIYPLSIKIDDNTIIQLFRKLHIMSTIDYRITYKEWVDQSTSNLIGFTEKEAKILFNTYKIYSNELEQTKSNTTVNTQNSRYESQKSNDSVDVRYFGLFFALQLFHQRSKSNFDTRDKNPYALNLNNFSSPMSSPRGKGQSSVRTGSNLEYQMILNFVKSNLKLFLRLIASDIHNTDTSLNSNEFNTLKIFFKSSEEGAGKNNLLSAYAPFFVNFSTTTKINIDIIYEWLINMIYSKQGPTNITSVNISYVGADIEDVVQLKNLSKCVTLKDNLQNKNIKITQCEDSYIYINSNINTVKISNCNNCTIVIGSVTKISSIDKCENCNITIATYLLRVSNTIDSTIYSYSIMEPILFGDNRALVLAPHNICYNELVLQIKNAKFPQMQTSFINNFNNPINLNSLEKEGDKDENLNFHIMQAKDFSITVVPFSSDKCDSLQLTPKEYIDVINEREFKMNKVKSLIKESNLGEEQEKALHVAIQGYFREWLVSSGNIKNLTEIVKMIDINQSNSFNSNSNNINSNIFH